MAMIEVDFEVFKALTARREQESVTPNDVLRGLLGLGSGAVPLRRLFGFGGKRGERKPNPPVNDWFYKGINFRVGTELRARHKGAWHQARIVDGGLQMRGRRFSSPSEAASAVTGTNVNGWRFWQCRFPGEVEWRPLELLRRDS